MINRKEKDIIIYKNWLGLRINTGIINKILGNGLYLVDDCYWNDDKHKVQYSKIIKESNIISNINN